MTLSYDLMLVRLDSQMKSIRRAQRIGGLCSSIQVTDPKVKFRPLFKAGQPSSLNKNSHSILKPHIYTIYSRVLQ